MIAQIIALFCYGTFYGTAVYISMAQHPEQLAAFYTEDGTLTVNTD